MTHFTKIRKDATRMPPNVRQGAWIIYQMKLAGISQQTIASNLGVSRQIVQQVVYGLRTSHRVQTAIAKALGYKSWSDLTDGIRKDAA